MSRYRSKASVTLISLMLIACVYLMVFFAVNKINEYKLLKIKGELDLYLNLDDSGSELLSFAQSSSEGISYMLAAGLMEASPLPREFDLGGEIGRTLERIRENTGNDYSLYIRDAAGETLSESASATSPGNEAGGISGISGIAWPTEYRQLTDGYGWRFEHPVHGDTRFHYGIDIRARQDSSIFSATEGEVVRVDKTGTTGLGKYVMINTGRYHFRYGHLSRVMVNAGDHVDRGEEIGKAGSTGYSTGPHLHFEIREIKDGDNSANPPQSRAVPPCPLIGNPSGCYKECYDPEDKNICGNPPDYVLSQDGGNIMTIPLPGGRRGTMELSIWQG